MKLLKLSIAAAVTGMFIGANTIAQPVYYDSYVFTGTSDDSLNGSTITIEGSIAGHTLYNWDLMDSDNGVTFTPDNSSFNADASDIISYNPTTWTGNFTVDSDIAESLESVGVPNFVGENSLSGGSLTYNPGGGGTILVGSDPAGYWTAVVPDVASNFQLCALALGVLGAFHIYIRSRTPVLVQN
jgi:hypothetical protein